MVKELHRKVGLPASRIQNVVETVLDITKDALERGEAVKLSRFGQFMVKEKAERIGRNPQTGESMVIPAHKVLSFRPSKVLKDRINRDT